MLSMPSLLILKFCTQMPNTAQLLGQGPGELAGRAQEWPHGAQPATVNTSPASPAIALLKDKDPGAFLIRDSHSFQGAYGLALKVATPPPSAQPWKGTERPDPQEKGSGAGQVQRQDKGWWAMPLLGGRDRKWLSCSGKNPGRIEGRNLESDKAFLSPPGLSGDPLEQLVRHFLIETGPKGVKIKGCPSEPYFGEKLGLGRLQWFGLGRPRDFRRVAGSPRHPRTSLTSPCRQPVRPGLPALHLAPVPALLPAHSQQRWVFCLSIHLSLPTAACLPLGWQRAFCSSSQMPLPADLPAGPSLQILWRRPQRSQCLPT